MNGSNGMNEINGMEGVNGTKPKYEQYKSGIFAQALLQGAVPAALPVGGQGEKGKVKNLQDNGQVGENQKAV